MLEANEDIYNEAKATFRFVGDNIDPSVITAQLGILPSKAHRKGDVVEKHPDRVYPTGYWGLASSISPSLPLEDHLKYLLDRLENSIPDSTEKRSILAR